MKSNLSAFAVCAALMAVAGTAEAKRPGEIRTSQYRDLEAQNRYVIAEAPGGLAGFENLVFATPAPKGWQYEFRKNALVLSKKNGLMILIY